MIGSRPTGSRRVRGTYLTALMGMGLWVAGETGAAGHNQAIDPVNVAGQGTPAATGAAPALAPPATAAQAPQNVPATQAVTPPNVATPATPPTPTPTPTPIATPTPAPAQAAPTPAAVVTPATPATGPATIAAPTPVAPGTAATNAAATSAAPTTVAATTPAEPQKIEVTTVEGEGKAYPVTELKIEYLFPHPKLPSVDELLNTEVQLGVVDGGYVAPRTGIELVRVRIGDIGRGPVKKIFRSGITAIYGGVLRFLNSKGIIGVFVVVNKNDIQIDERDSKRDRDARLVEGSEDVYKYTSLNIQIVTSVVKDIRTVAIGESSDASRVNNPRDAHIKGHSPLQPAKEGDAERNDLLRKDLLDDYVLRLNRYTGRHVDVAVSGTNKVGELNLDYLVSQGRPWYAFAQIANTGTSQTAEFRERFGYVHNELTGHDDVLSLDYATAGFSKSHSIMGAYEIPFFDFERVRTRVYGNWNEYTASDVGLNSVNFSGSQWLAGAEAIINVYQKRDFFVDAIGGVRAQYVESNNETSGTPGKATFFEPYGGFKFERLSDISSTTGLVMLTSYITSADQADVDGLGRVNASLAPFVLHFDFDQSFFLEPLIDPQKFSLGQSTLAHELFMTLHGQYGFGNRLFPQAQDVVGGLYSVRGYPESIVSGDNVVVGSIEYRLHIPRLLPIQNDPSKTPFLWNKSFRFSPQQAYAKPDWDLLFRAFIDAGVAINAQRQVTTEKDASLIGAGIGMELQYKQNFNLRVDWGTAITPVYDGSVGGGKIVDEGSQRVHISATILY